MARLEWEKAAKRDYVRAHGSVRADLEHQRVRPEQSKTGKRLAAKFTEKVQPLLEQFKALPPEDRVEQIGQVEARITELALDEKKRVPLSRKRFAVMIDRAAKQARAEVRTAAGLSKKRSRPLMAKRRSTPAEQKTKKAPKPSTAEQLLAKVASIDLDQRLDADGTLNLAWTAIPDVREWFVAVRNGQRPGKRKIVHRQNLPGKATGARVEGIRNQGRGLTVTVVAISGGKEVARTQQPVGGSRTRASTR